ncbi:MAG: type II toxin-antitoxin system HicB family antitoxin [Bryobacterales bacterium]|nr:type II toxin-antitoxin system HicB family antitoxin [Bryobacterales bacterium]
MKLLRVGVRELQKALRDSIEEYLKFCHDRGEDPDKPYSGNFIVRVDPELHRELAIRAATKGVSLNAFVRELLAQVSG